MPDTECRVSYTKDDVKGLKAVHASIKGAERVVNATIAKCVELDIDTARKAEAVGLLAAAWDNIGKARELINDERARIEERVAEEGA